MSVEGPMKLKILNLVIVCIERVHTLIDTTSFCIIVSEKVYTKITYYS